MIDHPLLGKQAAVRLDTEGMVWIEGVLINLTANGDAEMLMDGRATTMHCWPALQILARHNRMV